MPVLLTDHVNREIDAAKPFDYANKSIPKIEDSCFAMHSLAPFLQPDKHTDQDRDQLLKGLQKSCEEVGFFLLTDHGVDISLIERAHELSTKFFQEASQEEKDSLSGEYYLGYTASENVGAYQKAQGAEKTPDPVEKFSLFAEGPDRNLWPKSQGEAYKQTMTDYHTECHKLGLFMEELTERIMGVEKGAMRKWMSETMKSGVIRLHLYNEQAVVKEVLGGHTDLSTITLVSTTQPGYEVLVEGQWQPIPHMGPGVFVVNLGDVYKALTNGIFKSAIHRVNSAATGVRRSSINYFATTVAEFENEPKIRIDTFPLFEGKGIQYTPLDLRHEIKRRFGLIKVEEEDKDEKKE